MTDIEVKEVTVPVPMLEGSMVTEAVCICNVINPDGKIMLCYSATEGTKISDMIGMLQMALDRQRAAAQGNWLGER